MAHIKVATSNEKALACLGKGKVLYSLNLNEPVWKKVNELPSEPWCFAVLDNCKALLLSMSCQAWYCDDISKEKQNWMQINVPSKEWNCGSISGDRAMLCCSDGIWYCSLLSTSPQHWFDIKLYSEWWTAVALDGEKALVCSDGGGVLYCPNVANPQSWVQVKNLPQDLDWNGLSIEGDCAFASSASFGLWYCSNLSAKFQAWNEVKTLPNIGWNSVVINRGRALAVSYSDGVWYCPALEKKAAWRSLQIPQFSWTLAVFEKKYAFACHDEAGIYSFQLV